MKEKFKKKYLPPSYKDHLLDQLNNLRIDSMSVQDYMTKFNDVTLRCDVREDPQQTPSRFRYSLRPRFSVSHGLCSRCISASIGPKDLPQSPIRKEVPLQIKDQLKHQFESPTKPDFSTTKDPQSKSAIGESSQQPSGYQKTKCYMYQDFDHLVAQCPTRNLFQREHQLRMVSVISLRMTLVMLRRR